MVSTPPPSPLANQNGRYLHSLTKPPEGRNYDRTDIISSPEFSSNENAIVPLRSAILGIKYNQSGKEGIPTVAEAEESVQLFIHHWNGGYPQTRSLLLEQIRNFGLPSDLCEILFTETEASVNPDNSTLEGMGRIITLFEEVLNPKAILSPSDRVIQAEIGRKFWDSLVAGLDSVVASGAPAPPASGLDGVFCAFFLTICILFKPNYNLGPAEMVKVVAALRYRVVDKLSNKGKKQLRRSRAPTLLVDFMYSAICQKDDAFDDLEEKVAELLKTLLP